MRRLPRVLMVVPAMFLVAGCGAIQDMGGVMDLAQACDEATELTGDLIGRTAGLTGDPGGLKRALDDTAVKLGKAAARAGEPTLNEALTGLATTYRTIDTTNAAAAVDRIRSDTADYLQVITRACG
ncbi:hypothetical protein [Nonomuraea sp. NPDC046570]|uniref:hypothetical protein n=1 Tax=Nonomuraea sp. NPDC046570 TaxID=3155255 RepID=UPI0033FB98E0